MSIEEKIIIFAPNLISTVLPLDCSGDVIML